MSHSVGGGSGAGNAWARLLAQPDTAVATIKGKTVSAGQVRKWLRSLAARRGKPRLSAAARKAGGPGMGTTALRSQSRMLIAALQQESGGQGRPQPTTLRASAARISPTSSAVFGSREAEGALQAEPCSSRPVPGLATVQGAGEGGGAQPGGVLILRGRCLGAVQGTVRMYGAFPGPYVSLQISMWTDSAIAAVVPPDLTGVIDQIARLQIVTADGAGSNQKRVQFVARRETMQLPASLVQRVRCGNAATDCATAAATHFAMRGQDSYDPSFGDLAGHDSWQVQVGNGWGLNSLDLTNAFGSFQIQGFDQGPPDFAAFAIGWGASQSVETTSRDCVVCVSDTTDTYLAAYSIVVTASGPAGVSPDPSVKPPYSERHGPADAGIAGFARSKMPHRGGNGGSPASRAPANWNAPPAASGPAAGTQFTGSVRPVRTPGQPTTPAPGEGDQ